MSGAPIQCQVRLTCPIGLIEVVGSLRQETTPHLREAVRKTLIDRPDAIVLDLAGLDDIENLNAAVFPALGHVVAGADGELLLAVASPGVRDVLHRARPLFVRVFDTCDQAIAAATRAPARRRVTRQLPADQHAGRTARRVLDEVCRRWELPLLRDPALLIVTELATNAVQYAGGPVELCVTVRHRVLRIEISDGSTVLPVAVEPAPGVRPGHGLRLVDSLASHWGVLRTRWGKTVWADLVIPDPA